MTTHSNDNAARETLNPTAIRKGLGSKWKAAVPCLGGWRFNRYDQSAHVIVSAAVWTDGIEYVHASIAKPDSMPEYEDLVLLHEAVFRGYAYQVFAPPERHVNIYAYALHLWGRADGDNILPEFGLYGTI